MSFVMIFAAASPVSTALKVSKPGSRVSSRLKNQTPMNSLSTRLLADMISLTSNPVSAAVSSKVAVIQGPVPVGAVPPLNSTSGRKVIESASAWTGKNSPVNTTNATIKIDFVILFSFLISSSQ
jgi:hypothetical protein